MVRRIPTYIHELADWPHFQWDQGAVARQLAAVRLRQGRLIGRMQALGFRQQEEAVLATLTEDVLKSSEIEGEILDKDQVRSSIARRLGMDAGALPPADRNVCGRVRTATNDYSKSYDNAAQPDKATICKKWAGFVRDRAAEARDPKLKTDR